MSLGKKEVMATNNTRALWALTRGQRTKFAAALVALAISAALLYVGPQIVRMSIDGILDKQADRRALSRWMRSALAFLDAANHPTRALIVAGCAVLSATLLGGVFMYLKG